MKKKLPVIITALLLIATGIRAEPGARLLVSNPEPYLGEAFVLSVAVHRDRLSGVVNVSWPAVASMAVEAQLPGTVHRRAGPRSDEVVENLRRLVRPLRSGPLLLTATTAGNTSPRMQPAPLQIHVRPLPQQGKPARFSGMVGQLAYRLVDEVGRGRRQVVLELSGDADLTRAQSPLSTRTGDVLTLLDEQLQRRGNIFIRRLRYLYSPADDGRGELRVRLNWFDPRTGRYHQTGAGGPQPSRRLLPATIALLLLAAAATFLYRRTRRNRHLRAWLDEEHPDAPRSRRLARLAAAGGSEELLTQLERYWQQRDRRFAADGQAGKASLPPAARRALLRMIDKHGSFRR
ncbi:hypothetical protein C2E25_03105 [Geothermobacter hydrogeniphilus]|uniref:Oxygen tolerance n=1 Tax=Geothermobacter hydrogeniphilus TaxID=1969733 RepID=A0A2K2HDC3_9BACT|nr:BatD family protein [Geothermobacter hydrogeniphilus]PNU21295.1 hypothetical protein C2E25_03105 [Geothermobacter hydrogeniphilus]